MTTKSHTDIPHLTPKSLVGRRFAPDTFKGITVALVGFCPRPSRLDCYHPQPTVDQYFIHVTPASVEVCAYGGMRFLSISHVYGGPVASALIEELAYFGIKYLLAYGLAGGLGTKQLQMGDFYLVKTALAMDGTTPHYTDDKLIQSDADLNAKIGEFAESAAGIKMTPVQASTSDAIYREYDRDLEYAKNQGCDIVNCDSSHLFAVSKAVGIKSTQCGVISDVAMGEGEDWESELSAMLTPGENAQDPIALVGQIVKFYVEDLIGKLDQ